MNDYFQVSGNECSKCHKVNDSELLQERTLRGTEDTIRRCKNCGHRKIISSVDFNSKNYALNQSIKPKIQVF